MDDAIGGRSSKSFIDEGHLTAILAVIKPGDYLFAEWGINDRYTSDTTRYTNPATTYRTYLQQYIDGARSKNAIPVIITPTPRLDYQNGVFNNGYVAYCAADAAVAASSNTPLIDLQTMALAYYTQIGITAVQTTIVSGLRWPAQRAALPGTRSLRDGQVGGLGGPSAQSPHFAIRDSGQIGRRLAERFAGPSEIDPAARLTAAKIGPPRPGEPQRFNFWHSGEFC